MEPLNKPLACEQCGNVLDPTPGVAADGLLCPRCLGRQLVRRSPEAISTGFALFGVALIVGGVVCGGLLGLATGAALIAAELMHAKSTVPLWLSLGTTALATLVLFVAGLTHFLTRPATRAMVAEAGKWTTGTVLWLLAAAVAGYLFALVTCLGR